MNIMQSKGRRVMESRIHNPHKAKQLIDFMGCQVGSDNMYPTDIDALIEYKDKEYIIFEVKFGDTPVPLGQKLALQRMVDDFTKVGKQAIVFVCEHTVRDAEKPIIMARCRVREIYYGDEKQWRAPEKTMTVREALSSFLRYSTAKPQQIIGGIST